MESSIKENNSEKVEPVKVYEQNKNCISLEELQSKKISQEEMEKLPAYRNYKEGIPRLINDFI